MALHWSIGDFNFLPYSEHYGAGAYLHFLRLHLFEPPPFRTCLPALLLSTGAFLGSYLNTFRPSLTAWNRFVRFTLIRSTVVVLECFLLPLCYLATARPPLSFSWNEPVFFCGFLGGVFLGGGVFWGVWGWGGYP